MASCCMSGLQIEGGLFPWGHPAVEFGVQLDERHSAEAAEQQRLGIPERAVEPGIHGLFDGAIGPIGAVADREKFGRSSAE